MNKRIKVDNNDNHLDHSRSRDHDVQNISADLQNYIQEESRDKKTHKDKEDDSEDMIQSHRNGSSKHIIHSDEKTCLNDMYQTNEETSSQHTVQSDLKNSVDLLNQSDEEVHSYYDIPHNSAANHSKGSNELYSNAGFIKHSDLDRIENIDRDAYLEKSTVETNTILAKNKGKIRSKNETEQLDMREIKLQIYKSTGVPISKQVLIPVDSSFVFLEKAANKNIKTKNDEFMDDLARKVEIIKQRLKGEKVGFILQKQDIAQIAEEILLNKPAND